MNELMSAAERQVVVGESNKGLHIILTNLKQERVSEVCLTYYPKPLVLSLKVGLARFNGGYSPEFTLRDSGSPVKWFFTGMFCARRDGNVDANLHHHFDSDLNELRQRNDFLITLTHEEAQELLDKIQGHWSK